MTAPINLYAAAYQHRVPVAYLALNLDSTGYISMRDLYLQLASQKYSVEKIYHTLLERNYSHQPRVVLYYMLELFVRQGHTVPATMVEVLQRQAETSLSSPAEIAQLVSEMGDYGNTRQYARDFYLGKQAVEILARLQAADQSLLLEDIFQVRMAHYKANLEEVASLAAPRSRIDPHADASLAAPRSRIDPHTLFDQARVSPRVPYICFVTAEGQKIYKLYRGDIAIDDPNYASFVPEAETHLHSHHIYLAVQTASEPKETYQLVSLDLSNFELAFQVTYSSFNEQLIQSRISEAFPLLRLGELRRGALVASFNLIVRGGECPPFQDHLFLDLLLTDPLFSRHLYIKEAGKVTAFKPRLRLQYRTPFSDVEEAYTATSKGYVAKKASVTFNMSLKTAAVGSTFVFLHQGSPRTAALGKASRHFHFKITKAESETAIEEFTRAVKSLLCLYLRLDLSQLAAYYRHWLGSEGPAHSKIDKDLGRRSQVKPQRHVKYLRSVDPEVFEIGYPSIASGKRQPDVTKDPAQARQWLQENKKVLAYPPRAPGATSSDGSPRFWFTCRYPEYPHPGLVANTMRNKDKFPLVPQCYKSDQMQPGKATAKAYQTGSMILESKEISDRTRKAQTLLEPGKDGEMTPLLSSLLANIANSSGFKRLGVVKAPNPNSLLHCVLKAIRHPEYLAHEAQDRAAEYVRQFRSTLSSRLDPELLVLSQELYDFSLERRRADLDNPQLYMDPRLFYRALEVVFEVNIFVFFRSTKTGETDRVDLPRHKHFHVHAYDPRRPTVVVMCHYGTKTAAARIPYPHCELVAGVGTGSELTLLHNDANMGGFCHQILKDTNNLYTWVPDPQQGLRVYGDLYNLMNYMELLDDAVQAQVLDDYGKARCFVVRAASNFTFALVVPPAYPLNVPAVKAHESLPRPSLAEVAELLKDDRGRPLPLTAVTVDNGLVDGLWFEVVGVQHGLYVPVLAQASFSELGLPQGPRNPIRTSRDSKVGNLIELRRNLDLLLQLLYWCLDVWRMQSGDVGLSSPETTVGLSSFITRLLPLLHAPGAANFDFSGLPAQLPVVTGIRDALSHIARYVPGLVKDFQFQFGDELRRKLIYLLTKYDRGTRHSPIRPATYIEGYYSDYTHYSRYDNTEVFVGEADLQMWLQSRKVSAAGLSGQEQHLVRGRIYEKMSQAEQPFLYQQGVVFLIYNPPDGSLEAALRWAAGLAPSERQLPTRYDIYTVDSSGFLVLTQSGTRFTDHEVLPLVISYGSGRRFAGAMIIT